MSTNRVTTAALLAALAMAPWPANAQEAVERRDSSARQDRQRSRQEGRQEGRKESRDDGQARGGNRRAPRDNGNDDAAQTSRREAERARDEAVRQRDNNRARPDREAVPRYDRRDNDRRDNDRQRDWDRDRNNRDNGYRDRDRGWNGNGRYVPRPNYNRYSRPPRVYVVPYGYRPRNYRPGWSANLYFGRPFGGYYDRYPGYYGNGYGYFDITSGFAYGSVRIIDAPRDARVFVDGYYAGVVDDYDGVFQRLNLEPGGHYIELDVYPGTPPLEFDVFVEPGRTLTIHARP